VADLDGEEDGADLVERGRDPRGGEKELVYLSKLGQRGRQRRRGQPEQW
jgi:hypothetical protein